MDGVGLGNENDSVKGRPHHSRRKNSRFHSALAKVAQQLELRDEQVQGSRQLLKDRGNMSSATLPHLWERLLNDDSIPSGTPIVSFAFGPGLTICGSLMEKL